MLSGSPNIRFMFWIAWPAAPLTRLSSTTSTTTRSVPSGRWTAIRSMFDARTERVSGIDARRHHVDERLPRVALLEERLHVDVGLRHRRVERREDAAHGGRQVRREHQRQRRLRDRGEALRDLRVVAMALDAVGGEVVRGLGEQQVDLGLAPRTRHARLAVGDHVLRVDHAGLDQRQEAELHGGRVAAGVADDARLADRLAVHLRQAVHALGQQVGARVRHLVPALEQRRVLEPEVGGEVDDLDAGVDELARLRHRDAVRRGEEHEVALREAGLVGLDERERVVAAAQAREHVGDAACPRPCAT